MMYQCHRQSEKQFLIPASALLHQKVPLLSSLLADKSHKGSDSFRFRTHRALPGLGIIDSQMRSDRAAKSPAIRATALKIQVFQPQTDELCPETLSGQLP